VFNTFFDTTGGFALYADHPEIAVGGNRVYVLDESAVSVFNADTLAQVAEFATYAEHAPWAPGRGLAYYRGELYVARGDGSILVLDAATGEQRRVLRGPQVVYLQSQGDWLPYEGIDVAWGEVWIKLGRDPEVGDDRRANASQYGIAVIDAQTGAMKSLMLHLASQDCVVTAPSSPYCVQHNGAGLPPTMLDSWWDIAAVPELNGLAAGCGFLERRGPFALASLAEPLSWNGDPTPVGCLDRHQEGVGSVWGMKWLLEMDAVNAQKGQVVREYSLVGDAVAGAHATLAREWKPQQRDDVGGDVAYRNRAARIDATGDLTTERWMGGQRCLTYVVSDADIFVVKQRGERWYEQARNLERVDLTVDGTPRATSTSPTGTLCVDTNTVASGLHAVRLAAKITGRPDVEWSNRQLHVDHDPPTISVRAPLNASGTVVVSATMSDAHAGLDAAHIEIAAPGGGWATLCQASSPPPAQLDCGWETDDDRNADGTYRLRAVANDLSDPANTGISNELAVTVDNDADKDGVRNRSDACPTVYARTADGCPAPPPEAGVSDPGPWDGAQEDPYDADEPGEQNGESFGARTSLSSPIEEPPVSPSDPPPDPSNPWVFEEGLPGGGSGTGDAQSDVAASEARRRGDGARREVYAATSQPQVPTQIAADVAGPDGPLQPCPLDKTLGGRYSTFKFHYTGAGHDQDSHAYIKWHLHHNLKRWTYPYAYRSTMRVTRRRPDGVENNEVYASSDTRRNRNGGRDWKPWYVHTSFRIKPQSDYAYVAESWINRAPIPGTGGSAVLTYVRNRGRCRSPR
jgi:hypothetical protein